MKMPDPPLDGGCRCGKVRFCITARPLMTAACHCTGCQRMTASAFSTTLIMPVDGFEVTQGEPVIGGLHGHDARHHHCDWCKSWLFTRLPPQFGAVNVRATMLDDARWFEPFMETYISEKLPWATTPARHSYAAFPPMEEFGPLVAAFAKG